MPKPNKKIEQIFIEPALNSRDHSIIEGAFRHTAEVMQNPMLFAARDNLQKGKIDVPISQRRIFMREGEKLATDMLGWLVKKCKENTSSISKLEDFPTNDRQNWLQENCPKKHLMGLREFFFRGAAYFNNFDDFINNTNTYLLEKKRNNHIIYG